ncbi:hypothetical protein JJJ17_03480 [Paracoccus caeni]|uniref:Uncharacterized protein n=1 Tax=Paracoccus caeni TaxID=657651 RepID=A0A934VZ69_9RHOB|nr:hypothetical protein [Paracoccus caeni]MBK4214983.1 hypothetical protein [Paracoccus caeni]
MRFASAPPGAPGRIARLFAASDPQTLRQIFEASAGLAHSTKNYRPNRRAFKDLVAPYLQDTRVTQDVDGNRPPVSHQDAPQILQGQQRQVPKPQFHHALQDFHAVLDSSFVLWRTGAGRISTHAIVI